MSLILRKLRTLTRRITPTLGDIIHLYSQETGKDHWITLADLQSGGGYPDWSSTDAAANLYDIGSRVTYGLKLWESLIDNNNAIPSEGASWTEVSSATTTFEKIYERVEKTAHGFTVGMCLKKTNTVGSWAVINGSSDAQDLFRGVVIGVTDANNFVVALPGSRVIGLSGLTAGSVHYADASGVLTTTETGVKVLFADSATTGYIINGSGNGSLWGGLWNFSSNAGAFPTAATAGKMYVAEDDHGAPGDADYVAAGTWMASKVVGANEFSEYYYK